MAEQRPERPNRKPGRPGAGNGAFRFRNGLLGWLLFIGLAVMLVMLVQNSKKGVTTIPANEFFRTLNADRVASITVEEPEVTGKFVDPGEAIPGIPGKVTNFKVVFLSGWLPQNGFDQILRKQDGTLRQNVKIEAENNQNFFMQ